jgi:putative transposase
MSYVKIWIHCVWSAKNRDYLITDSLRPLLLSHIREYTRSKTIALDYINAHKDHFHALINLRKEQTIADIMHLIKGESSFWVNKMHLSHKHFAWQDDYYAASISYLQVDTIRAYIKNQDEHHKKMTWDEELKLFYKEYGYDKLKG